MKPSQNPSKKENIPTVFGISTVIISDDEKNERHGNVQFGSVPFEVLKPKTKNTCFDKEKTIVVFDREATLCDETIETFIGSKQL